MDGSQWDVVSIRFARTDAEAIAEGIAPDGDADSNRDALFTSNEGPGTKTTFVPLEWMPTGVPTAQITDDIVAAQQGHSVISGSCPYR